MKPQQAIFWRRFGWTLGYTLLFVIVCAAVYWFMISFFTIQSIEVVGGAIDVQVDQKRLPRTLLFFPSDTLRTQLLRDNPILADIKFKKKLPHTLVIVPTLRSAFAGIVSGGREVTVDGQGIVLADVDPSTPVIPRLIIPVEGIRVGLTIRDPRVIQSLAFLQGTTDMFVIDEIILENGSSLRAKSQKLDILFTQDRDIKEIITTLQTLIVGFRIKGTLPTYIDLRFDKPIVRF